MSVGNLKCLTFGGTLNMRSEGVTVDSNRMNREMYRALLCAQIQPSTVKLIGRNFPVQIKMLLMKPVIHTTQVTDHIPLENNNNYSK